MVVNNESSVLQLQQSFQLIYPGLKIEFYKTPHYDHEGSNEKYIIQSSAKLKDLNSEMENGIIEFHISKTVSDFEKEFKEKFGLHVQVFRQSNAIWLQTTNTDDWTLEKQNSKGLNSKSA